MSNNANHNLTKKERDCIIFIEKGSTGEFPIRVLDLAKSMKVKPPTVEELLYRLEEKKMIIRKRGMIMLTKLGKKTYTDIILCHRVLETFFVDCGVSVSDACEKISNFDYMIDTDTAKMILAKLGNPTKCPHGYNIIENIE
ncbi:MAG: metal-dependent transcriptional regulator [Thermoplasmata archaeon]